MKIRRGTIPLRGIDPMGEEYFALRDELDQAGIAIYRPLPDWHEEQRAESEGMTDSVIRIARPMNL